MTYPQMDPRRLDLTGTFGLRVAGRDAAEVRIGTAGRWGQRVNLATNPRGRGAGVYWGVGGSGVADNAPDGLLGGGWRRLTFTTPPTSSADITLVQTSTASPGFRPATGSVYRVTMYALAPRTEGTVYIQWAFRGSDGYFIGSNGESTGGVTALQSGPQSPSTGEWQRVAITTVPAWADAMSLYARLRLGAGTVLQPGDVAGAGAALIEDVTDLAAQWSALPDPKPTLDAWLDERLGDFFDGDTPNTPAALHHWTATPHASTSVRTLAWQPGD